MICWLGWHPRDPILTRRRDDNGKADPHVIEWQCRVCHRVIGVTEQRPKFRLIATLRAQVGRKRRAA